MPERLREGMRVLRANSEVCAQLPRAPIWAAGGR